MKKCRACILDHTLHTRYPIGEAIPEVQPAIVVTSNAVHLCFKHAKVAQALTSWVTLEVTWKMAF